LTRKSGAGDADRQAGWESKWARADFTPKFRLDEVPAEIAQAVEDGWFPPGGSVLDIGCGSGEIAAWLARRGFNVLGVDFAPSAIAKAQSAHAGAEGLSFEVVDIAREAPPGGPFDALVDRGCLQGVLPEHRPAYVRHVASVAKPGAHFLLVHRWERESATEEMARELETLWADSFDAVDVAETVMARRPATGEERPGLALRLVRRV
jgi:2-polyprenyl-3-methyl-5-hydroxy-6-metoxy-1,4-benzoquinol methylase